MKLDENSNPIAYEQSKDKHEEIKMGQNDHVYSDMWSGYQAKREIAQGRYRLIKMMKENKGLDRGKSYNPMMDAFEAANNGILSYTPEVWKAKISLSKKISWWNRFINWLVKTADGR